MRISDWSSDVCSSDLAEKRPAAIDSLNDEVVFLRQADLVPEFEEMRAGRHERERRQHDGGELHDPQTHDPLLSRPPAPLATGALPCQASGQYYKRGPLRHCRSEERRVGEACVRTCRTRGPLENKNNK